MNRALGSARSIAGLVFALVLVAAGTQAAPRYVPGEVLIGYKQSARPFDRLAVRRNLGGELVATADFIRLEQVRLRGLSVEQAIARLQRHPSVAFVQPNYIYEAVTTPNDPLFSSQWGMNNTGQTGGTPGADIKAVSAWSLATGDPNLKIGLIDSGVNYNHSDLAANIWTNPGEIPGNHIDDDHNGYVDDVHGYDFRNGDGDPMDDWGHGTECAGILAARGNNSTGVAGTAWQGKIVAIKFLGADGMGSSMGAINAVNYAVTVGAKLTSNSWGDYVYDPGLYAAINAAGQAGQLFVAGAGNNLNDNDINPFYPASFDLPYVVAVAASDHNDQLALFTNSPGSNYGATSVDLAAPGKDIVSTSNDGFYVTVSGSSMAAPHAAGVLALIYARWPTIPALSAKDLLLASVDVKPAFQGKVLTNGRLNAQKSLTEPALAIANPAGGVHWHAGSVQMVQWTGIGPVAIDVSPDDGASYINLVASTTSHDVQVSMPSLCTTRARVRVRRIVWGTAVAISGQFVVVPNPTRPWSLTTVIGGYAGNYSSLRLDASDQPQIAYAKPVNPGIDISPWHSYWNGTGFTSTQAGPTTYSGQYMSLALASDGSPRIAFLDYIAGGGRKLLTKSGGVWTSEPIGTGLGGSYMSLALNAANLPRVAFQDQTISQLKYGSKSGSTWTFWQLTTGSSGGLYCSLALDPTGNPRVSFDQQGLRYRAGEYEGPSFITWSPTEIVDSARGFYTSLALDSQGNPRIAYHDINTTDLKYAFKSGGSWTIENVDQVGDVGKYASLALAPDGHPFISYYGDGVLKLAERVDGVWQIGAVDTSGNTGWNTSIRITSTGLPRISYRDLLANSLRYAVALPPPPPPQVVQGPFGGGSGSGLTHLTYDLTLAAAANRMGLVYVATNGTQPSSVTINGSPCSLVGTAINDASDPNYNQTGCFGYLYSIMESSLPGPGTYPVAVNFSSPTNAASIASMASGVNQATPFGGGISNVAGPPANSIATNVSGCIQNGLVIDMVVADANFPPSWTPTYPQQWRGTVGFGNTALSISDLPSVPGTVTMSGNGVSNMALAQYAVELKPASGTGPFHAIQTEKGEGLQGPAPFALEGVRPNPATAKRLVVQFALSDATPAELELLDLAGRRLSRMGVGSLGPGRHSVNLGAGLPLQAGVYFVRLTQGRNSSVLRTTVLN